MDDIPDSPEKEENGKAETKETNSLINAKGTEESKMKMEDEALDLVVKVTILEAPLISRENILASHLSLEPSFC